MKILLISMATAITLFTSTAASAQSRPGTRDDNYGYAKDHRVTPQERARWEAEQKRKAELKRQEELRLAAQRRADRKDDRRDDRNDKDFNYGYAKNHRVTPQERARWEAAHKNQNRR